MQTSLRHRTHYMLLLTFFVTFIWTTAIVPPVLADGYVMPSSMPSSVDSADLSSPVYSSDSTEAFDHEGRGYRLYVVAGESMILHTRDVSRVAVADPDVADVVVVTRSEVLINGISPGKTTLHVWESAGRSTFSLIVYEDATALAKEIEQRIGESMLMAWVVQGSIILEGDVADVAAKERAIKIASAYSEQVIDLIRIPTRDSRSELKSDLDALIDRPGIRVTMIHDSVLLEGVVDHEFEKERAAAVARAFGHPVIDLIRVRETKVASTLAEGIAQAIGDPQIIVSKHGETILIEGQVQSELQKERADIIARAYSDQVVSLVRVVPPIVSVPTLPRPRLTHLPSAGANDVADPSDHASDLEIEEEVLTVVDLIRLAIEDDRIAINMYGASVFLEGIVSNDWTKQRARAIAEAYHSSVVDLLRVDDRPDEPIVEAIASSLAPGPSATLIGVPHIDEPTPADTPPDDKKAGLSVDERIQILTEALNEPMIRLIPVDNDVLLIDGLASTAHAKSRAVQIAEVYFDRVIDVTEVQSPDPPIEPGIVQQLTEALGRPWLSVRGVGDKVLVEGVVRDQNELERVLAISKAFGPEIVSFVEVLDPIQVLLEVQVVEMDKNAAHSLGLTWGSNERGAFIPHQHMIGELTVGGPIFRLRQFLAQIDTLVTDGHARILAQPRLLTLSRETAQFLAGGEIPVVIPQDGQTVIEWKPFGVILEITPYVDSADRIEVAIEAELSTLDWQNGIRIQSILIPAMSTRRVSSALRVAEGETLVMGGLISSIETKQVEKFPLLGDLPILGKLFSSEKFTRDETELIFFVTPTIVRAGIEGEPNESF